MLAQKHECETTFDFGIKYIKEQRVARLQKIGPISHYRMRARAAIETMLTTLVGCGENAADAPFCILHDHFDWTRDIDLEICVPVRRWAKLSNKLQSRTIPGTEVTYVTLQPNVTDCLAQTKKTLAALENAVIEKDRIFAGDVREVYPWRHQLAMEMQIPVV